MRFLNVLSVDNHHVHNNKIVAMNIDEIEYIEQVEYNKTYVRFKSRDAIYIDENYDDMVKLLDSKGITAYIGLD